MLTKRQLDIRRAILHTKHTGATEKVAVKSDYASVSHTDGHIVYVSYRPPNTSRDVYHRTYGSGLHEISHVVNNVAKVLRAAKDAAFKRLDYWCLNYVCDVHDEMLFRREHHELEHVFQKNAEDIHNGVKMSGVKPSFIWKELMTACEYHNFPEPKLEWQRKVRRLFKSCKKQLTPKQLLAKAKRLKTLLNNDYDYDTVKVWVAAREKDGYPLGDPQEWFEPLSGSTGLVSPQVTIPGESNPYYNYTTDDEPQFRAASHTMPVSTKAKEISSRLTYIFEETLQSKTRIRAKMQAIGKFDATRAFYANVDPMTVFGSHKTQIDVRYNVCILLDVSGSMYNMLYSSINTACDVASGMLLATKELDRLKVKVFLFDSYVYNVDSAEQIEAAKRHGATKGKAFGWGTNTAAALNVARQWVVNECEGPTLTFLITDGNVEGDLIAENATKLQSVSSLVEVLIGDVAKMTLTKFPIRIADNSLNKLFGQLITVLKRMVDR